MLLIVPFHHILPVQLRQFFVSLLVPSYSSYILGACVCLHFDPTSHPSRWHLPVWQQQLEPEEHVHLERYDSSGRFGTNKRTLSPDHLRMSAPSCMVAAGAGSLATPAAIAAATTFGTRTRHDGWMDDGLVLNTFAMAILSR